MRTGWSDLLFVLLFGLCLAACVGPGTEQMTAAVLPGGPTNEICPADSRNLFFAAPMCTTYRLKSTDPAPITAADADAYADAAKNPDERIAFISAALIDSRQKCTNFIKRFTGEQAGENSLLDVSALVLSGVAAAITGPASTIRGLAAGSTAVQGIKQTVNADFFQQLTVALFIQQINTTYFQVLDTEFPPSSLGTLTAAGSLARIQAIHRNCSIPFAAANISANQQKPQTGGGAQFSFTITGSPAATDTITLTAASASLNPSVALTARGGAGRNVLNMANQLAEKIYGTIALTQTGVSVTVTTLTSTSAKLTVQGGPSDIKWLPTTSSNASVTFASSGN
jgi:hypothetical protein